MPKNRQGGYNGGGTVVRASVGMATDRTKKHVARVQRQRETFAAEKAQYEKESAVVLIKADSPAGLKTLLERKASMEKTARKAKARAERKALRDAGAHDS